MASKKLNVQLIRMQKDGSKDQINPFTTSKNVSVIPQNNIPSSATDTQSVFNALGAIAFEGGDEDVVFIGSDESEDVVMPESEVNDEIVSVSSAWSSQKVNSFLQDAVYIGSDESEDVVMPESEINDDIVSESSTWSSQMIYSYLQQINHMEYVDENSNITANCLPPSEY